jgi:hypothetical protein
VLDLNRIASSVCYRYLESPIQFGFLVRGTAPSAYERCRIHRIGEDSGKSLFSCEKRRSIMQYRLHFVCKHTDFVNFQMIDSLTKIVRTHPLVGRFSQSEGGIATHLLRP